MGGTDITLALIEIKRAMGVVDLLSFVDNLDELSPDTLPMIVGLLYQCLLDARDALDPDAPPKRQERP